MTYCTGVKNRVPDEVLDETVHELFAEEGVSFMNIQERWIEKGKIIGFEEGVRASQERSREKWETIGFEKGLRASNEEVVLNTELTMKRKTILHILDRISTLSETNTDFITDQLAQIDQIKALDRLVNAAVDSNQTGLTKFMVQLLSEVDE